MNHSDSESDTDLNRLMQMVARHSKEFENLVSQSQSQPQPQPQPQQSPQQQLQPQEQQKQIYTNQVDNLN